MDDHYTFRTHRTALLCCNLCSNPYHNMSYDFLHKFRFVCIYNEHRILPYKIQGPKYFLVEPLGSGSGRFLYYSIISG